MTELKDCQVILEDCPICKCVLTSWAENQNSQWVCDTCGFGKNSINEYKTLQKIVKYRKKYFQYDYMKSLESSYMRSY